MSDTLILGPDGKPLYSMGLLPSPPDEKRAYRAYGDSGRGVPKSKWRPISFRKRYPVKVYNQGRHGSCVGHGGATGAAKRWAISGGTPHVFSPCFLYGLINGNRDAGASILAALKALETDGLCFEDEVPEGQIYRSSFSAQAFETAKRFRFKGYAVNDVEELGAGLQAGDIPVYGVAVGAAFQGYRGGLISVGWGGANHCVTADGMHQEGGEWILDGINSWGEEWGEGGFFKIRLKDVARDEIFMLTDVIEDPEEELIPPMAE